MRNRTRSSSRHARRRVGVAMIGVWIYGSAAATALTADDAEASTPVVTALGCAERVSCGGSCTAQLSTGFCLLAVKWEGRLGFGSIQIGPSIKSECSICECWYTYTNATGNLVFKRTTKIGCSGGFPGIETYVE